jgi:DNA polymerase-3 subunit gamma/tau
VAPAPGRPFSAPEAFRTPTSAPAEAGPSAPAAPAAPVPAAGGSGQKRLSRYQQLLSQARESDGPDARTQQPAPPYGRPGAPAAAPAGGDAVDSKYVEDIPSDDDIAIEESGVVGRPAIERLLNGRLIEERNHDGSPVT